MSTETITTKQHETLVGSLVIKFKEKIEHLNWQLEIKARTIQILKASNSDKVDLSDKELKQLAVLCHPDKHNGSKTANDMFVKINGMRN